MDKHAARPSETEKLHEEHVRITVYQIHALASACARAPAHREVVSNTVLYGEGKREKEREMRRPGGFSRLSVRVHAVTAAECNDANCADMFWSGSCIHVYVHRGNHGFVGLHGSLAFLQSRFTCLLLTRPTRNARFAAHARASPQSHPSLNITRFWPAHRQIA